MANWPYHLSSIYKYPTTLHRSSYDVINILTICSHLEHHLKKPDWQHEGPNLRCQYQSTACYPLHYGWCSG